MFAVQNVIADVPFSKLDLISCRNLLIYLEPEVQKKLIALFHFALRDEGCLFLGNAETIGQNEDLFEPLSKKMADLSPELAGTTAQDRFPARPCAATAPRARAVRTLWRVARSQFRRDRPATCCWTCMSRRASSSTTSTISSIIRARRTTI